MTDTGLILKYYVEYNKIESLWSWFWISVLLFKNSLFKLCLSVSPFSSLVLFLEIGAHVPQEAWTSVLSPSAWITEVITGTFMPGFNFNLLNFLWTMSAPYSSSIYSLELFGIWDVSQQYSACIGSMYLTFKSSVFLQQNCFEDWMIACQDYQK